MGAVATRNDVLYSTENRRDERHTSYGLSRQPRRWQSRLARRFSLAEPTRPLSGATCSIGTIETTDTTDTQGTTYPGGAPQPDPIRRFILTDADVARRVATGLGYPGQVTVSRGCATDDLASLTIVSFYSSFPNYLCVWAGAAGRTTAEQRSSNAVRAAADSVQAPGKIVPYDTGDWREELFTHGTEQSRLPPRACELRADS